MPGAAQVDRVSDDGRRRAEAVVEHAAREHARALAAGLDDPGVDDSNVPPPVSVKTNVGGGSSSSDANKEGQGTYLPAEETAAQLELAEGLEVNVFASEAMFPEVVNPVQMAVDPRGRLWVASWPTYPKWEQVESKTMMGEVYKWDTQRPFIIPLSLSPFRR